MGSGPRARDGSRVAVEYAGWLPDGTQFDARMPPEDPIEFTIGEHRVIRGWEEGIEGMREGGQRQLVVPPGLGYGDAPVGRIPGGSTLVFLVHVVAVR